MKNLENVRSLQLRLNSSSANDSDLGEGDQVEAQYSSVKPCQTRTLTIRPLRAKNIDGQWKVIANIVGVIEQTVRINLCRY